MGRGWIFGVGIVFGIYLLLSIFGCRTKMQMAMRDGLSQWRGSARDERIYPSLRVSPYAALLAEGVAGAGGV